MRVKEKLLSPWLTIRVQLALGAIFLFAGIAKIADPPGFAHEVSNYRLLPAAAAVNSMALVLPWLEVFAGLALVLGCWRRTAAAIFGLLLVVFIGAISINLVRGHPIDCGCFGTSKTPRTESERLADMKLAIARDVGMLAMVAQLLAATRREG